MHSFVNKGIDEISYYDVNDCSNFHRRHKSIVYNIAYFICVIINLQLPKVKYII